MAQGSEQADEFILAAFLAGDLPTSLRKEIASYIATNDRARATLAMAQDAIDAVKGGDGYYSEAAPAAINNRNSPDTLSSPMPLIGMGQLWKVTALFASAVLILTLTVAILVFDGTSSTDPLVTDSWSPSVASDFLQLSWPSFEDAAVYQLLALDRETGVADVIARTTETMIDLSSSETMTSLLNPQGAYTIWILAFDGDSRMLSQSSSISISSP